MIITSDIVTKSRITVITRRFDNITNNYQNTLPNINLGSAEEPCDLNANTNQETDVSVHIIIQ